MSFALPSIDFSKLEQLFYYNSKEPLLFNTGFFVWLFAAFMVGYGLVYRANFMRTLYLTLFSLLFYYKSGGLIVFMLIGSTLADFLIGERIYQAEGKVRKKLWVTLSLLINVGALVTLSMRVLSCKTLVLIPRA